MFSSDSSIDCAHLFGFSVIDRCAATPRICGHGKCIPVQTGYTCQCEPGFKLSALQTNCIGKQQWEGERENKTVVTVGRLKGRSGTQIHTRWHQRPQWLCLSSSQGKHVFSTKHCTAQKPWWSEPKWKGYVCLCWPVLWCLTTAYGPSKELPRCYDSLPPS